MMSVKISVMNSAGGKDIPFKIARFVGSLLWPDIGLFAFPHVTQLKIALYFFILHFFWKIKWCQVNVDGKTQRLPSNIFGNCHQLRIT